MQLGSWSRSSQAEGSRNRKEVTSVQLPTPAIARATERQNREWQNAKLVNMFGRCKYVSHEAGVCDCVVQEFPPGGFELWPGWKQPVPITGETSGGAQLRSRQCPTCYTFLAEDRETCDWCHPEEKIWGEEAGARSNELNQIGKS